MGNGRSTATIDPLETGVKAIFSWVILMPIAVIVSGKLLGILLKMPRQSKQRFRIALPRMLNLEAHGDEAVFGFTAFIVNLFIVALLAGPSVHRLFREQFGVDPGQFNSLCAFSSFSSVGVSLFLIAAVRVTSVLRRRSDPVLQEHELLITDLAKSDEVGEA